MRNLDKVWNIWIDLDASYKKGNYKESKVNFLKKLVSNGNSKEILALLAKIATDIQNAADNKKYKYIQESMLAIINNYDFLPDNIDSLNTYVISLLQWKIKKRNNLTFDEFLATILPYAPLELKEVDFSMSNVGGEFITDKEVHKVKLCSEFALIAPRWMKNNVNSVTPSGSFGKKALETLKCWELEKPYPIVLVDERANLSNKIVEKKNGELCMICGDVSMAVKVI